MAFWRGAWCRLEEGRAGGEVPWRSVPAAGERLALGSPEAEEGGDSGSAWAGAAAVGEAGEREGLAAAVAGRTERRVALGATGGEAEGGDSVLPWRAWWTRLRARWVTCGARATGGIHGGVG